MSVPAALSTLEAYRVDPASENPDACQSEALDAEIGAREQALVTLRYADGRSAPADVSYRCGTVDPVTTACSGVVADGTAHPASAGILRFGVDSVGPSKPTTATVTSALPGAELKGIYRLNVAKLLDGGRAERLSADAPVALGPDKALMAIIAVFRTAHDRRSHKFVWYYGMNNQSSPAH